jgi:hypothetical protein
LVVLINEKTIAIVELGDVRIVRKTIGEAVRHIIRPHPDKWLRANTSEATTNVLESGRQLTISRYCPHFQKLFGHAAIVCWS